MSSTRQSNAIEWADRLMQPLLRFQHVLQPGHSWAARVRPLALIGAIGMPGYYLMWRYFFPQEYESLLLRLFSAIVFLPALWAASFTPKWLGLYVAAGLTYELPFFFTFMFLMNHASPMWSEALLVALVVLFHFETTAAVIAYVCGTALACVAFSMIGDARFLLSRAVLQQLPVHWFAIAVLTAVKLGRNVLADEKLAGVADGLATVAHELRTPLASVHANVRGLKRYFERDTPGDERESARMRDALGRIQFEVRHMNHMVDLFLLSATAVKQNLEPTEAMSMAGVVDALMARYPFCGTAQQATVAVEIRSDFVFLGQRELCVVMLLNLLRNSLMAIRRAGKGRIRIIVDGAREMPRLLFIDTGCGIAPSRMPMIFRRFYSYPAHNGSGIGLALCKDIMLAWDAKISCVSREGAYAIFVLEFPRTSLAPVPI
jgi:two-component system CAI-1 autoinducer sensor kinase/phosphatase CqsS